jgi:hypothetical protein
MHALAIVLVAIFLAACAAGGAIDYMRTEYGAAEKDGWVDISTDERQQIFLIWINKTKPKILVQTNLKAAADYGFVKGATYGAVSNAPVQPTFERAALRWFEENSKQNCKLSNPVKLHDVAWEFDYECGLPPTPIRVPAKPRRS